MFFNSDLFMFVILLNGIFKMALGLASVCISNVVSYLVYALTSLFCSDVLENKL